MFIFSSVHKLQPFKIEQTSTQIGKEIKTSKKDSTFQASQTQVNQANEI